MANPKSTTRSFILLIAILAPIAIAAPIACAQTTAATKSSKFDLPGTQQWVDTNITVRSGAKLHITATGQITYPADTSRASRFHTQGTFGPDGLPHGFADLIHDYPLTGAAHGALIGRLGSEDYSQPFLIGATQDYDVPVTGKLFLGINQSQQDAASATGSFQITIEILSEGTGDAAAAGGPAEAAIPGITPDLLTKIPRRVSDEAKNPGDMVNALIIGTQDQVVHVFTSAGWVQVDKDVGSTAVNAIFNSLEKKDYLTMPMSTLYLFNRPQDYGFAHAEPVRVAMSRNHLRVWKSPYEVDGRPLWCVAATHDVGFERDQRTNGLTHKIDPAIDGEREYVNGTLSGTGLVLERNHVTPPDPITTAKTATGGEFKSDGKILVLVLKNTAPQQ
jgi:hypothetical protein